VVLPQGYQVHIRNTIQAQLIALALISVLQETDKQDAEQTRTSDTSSSSAWVIDSCRRALRSCKGLIGISLPDRDRILGAIWSVLWTFFEFSFYKCKPASLIHLFAQLLGAFEPHDNSELQRQLQRCLPSLVTICSSHPRVLSECQRRLIPCINDILKDSKDRGVEFYEFLREDVRNPLMSPNERQSEEQARPSKRLRLENKTPDPQEQVYVEKLKEVTFALTGEYRTYLVGLQDTAL
jgi:hypothetical protein